MAKKTAQKFPTDPNPPQHLDDHIFFGLKLDDLQKNLRDAIWNEKKRIVFANCRSGTGKTLVSVATSILLVEYGFYDGIIYVASPHGYEKTGFLPGDITQKTEVFFEPLYQALTACNRSPDAVITNESIVNLKDGTAFIKPITHTFLRGTNLSGKVCILDESQNMTEDDLRKTLTRINSDSKVIVIGHTGQVDLPKPNLSGFEKCLRHFIARDNGSVAVCELTKNFRGWVSQTADEPWIE